MLFELIISARIFLAAKITHETVFLNQLTCATVTISAGMVLRGQKVIIATMVLCQLSFLGQNPAPRCNTRYLNDDVSQQEVASARQRSASFANAAHVVLQAVLQMSSREHRPTGPPQCFAALT